MKVSGLCLNRPFLQCGFHQVTADTGINRRGGIEAVQKKYYLYSCRVYGFNSEKRSGSISYFSIIFKNRRKTQFFRSNY